MAVDVNVRITHPSLPVPERVRNQFREELRVFTTKLHKGNSLSVEIIARR
jgi:hypothetical protein